MAESDFIEEMYDEWIGRRLSGATDKTPVRLPAPIQLRTLDARLKHLSQVKLDGARAYGVNALGATSFGQWARAAKDLRDPDMIRNAIYYGFQPLYDALIAGNGREGALRALDHVVSLGTTFLTGYYTGQPDDKAFREGMKPLISQIETLEPIRYRTKFRNIDNNGISTRGILLFLQQMLTATLDGEVTSPDYVVGCACGSSEIVMPLAGIMGVELGFIRRSHRRGDDDPTYDYRT